MSAKPIVVLSASVLFGAIVGAPNVALAQFGPPPGPPPMLAGAPPALAGGPPLAGFPAGAIRSFPPGGPLGAAPRQFAGGPAGRLDTVGRLNGLGRGEASLRGVAGYGANDWARRAGASHGGYGRRDRYGGYAAAAAYAYGSSYASSGDGCYYASPYSTYGTRRVLVCDGQ